jgi:palmitoyl-protein thioesterase
MEVVPLRQSPIYKEDWIGLKTLDKRGSLVLDLCHGVHMQIDAACQMKVFGKYVGIAPPSTLFPSSLRHGWSRVIYTLTGLRMSATPSSLQLLLLLFAVLVVQATYTGTRLLLGRRRHAGSIRLQ